MKTARSMTAPTESMLLSQQAAALVSETAEALSTLLRMVLMGALLLALLRVTFEVVGSHSSSVTATVLAMSEWLVVPFKQLPSLTAAWAAVITLILINGIVRSFDLYSTKEAT